MNAARKIAIVTGASQGIGAGIIKWFVERRCNVVANSRNVTQSAELSASDHVALGQMVGNFVIWRSPRKGPSSKSEASRSSIICKGLRV